LEDLGVDEKNNIKTDVRDSILGRMDWFNLAEDKFKCWTLVNMLTFRCDKIARSFLASKEPISFRRGLFCMQLITIYRPSAVLGRCKMPYRMFLAFPPPRMKYNIGKCHNKVAVLKAILNTLKWLSFLHSCMWRTDLPFCLVTKGKVYAVPQIQSDSIQSFNFICKLLR
jgi:hypothetical protein